MFDYMKEFVNPHEGEGDGVCVICGTEDRYHKECARCGAAICEECYWTPFEDDDDSYEYQCAYCDAPLCKRCQGKACCNECGHGFCRRCTYDRARCGWNDCDTLVCPDCRDCDYGRCHDCDMRADPQPPEY